MRAFVLAILAASLAGCLEEEEEEASEATGTDVMTYSNGHPILTETSNRAQLGVEDNLLRMTNDYRVARGLDALLSHPEARKASRAVARHMRVHQFVGHENPEGDGPSDRLSQAGVSFRECGENIAWGWDSAAEAFNFWVNSEPHRANLEHPGWTHAGMGFWSGGGSWGTYYAQEFVRLN